MFSIKKSARELVVYGVDLSTCRWRL